MELESILTSRNYLNGVAQHLIYEWEDVFCNILSIKLKKRRRIFDNKYAYKFPDICSFLQTRENSFVISLNDVGCVNRTNIIPQIVDFYIEDKRFNEFYYRYRNNPIVLLSSAEAFSKLKNAGCPLNIGHLPLSLPDKYSITPGTTYNKDIDCVCVGHQNKVLYSFLKQYAQKHSDFVYAYRLPNSFNYITSKGQELGSVDTREDYISLIRRSRIGLYSTPGMDDSTMRTKGYNQVTPRFLEYLAAGCHVIARYPVNEDTVFYDLPSITPNVDNYELFDSLVNRARTQSVDMKKYSDYLSNHYTSVRVNKLKQILQEI